MEDVASPININSRSARLLIRYGELLTIENIAEIFKYPSAEAVLKSHYRSSLPIKLFKFKNRKGWFGTTESAVNALNQIESEKTKINRV